MSARSSAFSGRSRLVNVLCRSRSTARLEPSTRIERLWQAGGAGFVTYDTLKSVTLSASFADGETASTTHETRSVSPNTIPNLPASPKMGSKQAHHVTRSKSGISPAAGQCRPALVSPSGVMLRPC